MVQANYERIVHEPWFSKISCLFSSHHISLFHVRFVHLSSVQGRAKERDPLRRTLFMATSSGLTYGIWTASIYPFSLDLQNSEQRNSQLSNPNWKFFHENTWKYNNYISFSFSDYLINLIVYTASYLFIPLFSYTTLNRIVWASISPDQMPFKWSWLS